MRVFDINNERINNYYSQTFCPSSHSNFQLVLLYGHALYKSIYYLFAVDFDKWLFCL